MRRGEKLTREKIIGEVMRRDETRGDSKRKDDV